MVGLWCFKATYASSPFPPDMLPSLEHNGIAITVINHHGFSRPDRGPMPASRILYGARDENNERHWRSSWEKSIN
jgi:hypothetical protein